MKNGGLENGFQIKKAAVWILQLFVNANWKWSFFDFAIFSTKYFSSLFSWLAFYPKNCLFKMPGRLGDLSSYFQRIFLTSSVNWKHFSIQSEVEASWTRTPDLQEFVLPLSKVNFEKCRVNLFFILEAQDSLFYNIFVSLNSLFVLFFTKWIKSF